MPIIPTVERQSHPWRHDKFFKARMGNVRHPDSGKQQINKKIKKQHLKKSLVISLFYTAKVRFICCYGKKNKLIFFIFNTSVFAMLAKKGISFGFWYCASRVCRVKSKPWSIWGKKGKWIRKAETVFSRVEGSHNHILENMWPINPSNSGRTARRPSG